MSTRTSTQAPFAVAHLSELPALRMEGQEHEEWRPVRAHLGIRAFGVNAYVAAVAESPIVPEHDERATSPDRQEHEELYYVAAGRATFQVAGETIDAVAGTFVFVRDPGTARSAVANEPGTTILVVGGQPGVAFRISPWEQSYTRSIYGGASDE